MAITIVTAIFTLVAGIGVFLIALKILSTNLELLSGDRLKALFSKTSKSKLFGVGIGTVATAAIQSSGAVSVMVIGFVSAGMMSLAQAATIIFGANIGTTITAQIVSLGMLGSNTLSTTVIFSAFAGIGAAIGLFAKKDKTHIIGGLITGFGLLFVALGIMTNAMNGMGDLPQFKEFLAQISNPVLLVLIGAAFTALVQSSSVITGIAITMLVSGLITLDQGIYVTLGSNIGSCVVAVIACIGGSSNVKRTAFIHFFFNVFGVVIFLIIDAIMRKSSSGVVTFANLFAHAFPNVPSTQLAMLHTFFNIATVIVILPMTNLLVRFVTKIIPEKKEKPDPNAPHLFFVEDHFLSTPPIAVAQTKKEILNMAEIAMSNFNLSLETICTMDFSNSEKFERDEDELNFLTKEIVRFVVALSKTELSEHDHIYLTTVFHSVTDLERIGDYAENIMEYAAKLKSIDSRFSDDAISEIRDLQELIGDLYGKVMKAYSNCEIKTLQEAYEIEELIDIMTDKMSQSHIDRLDIGVCTPDVGAQYLSLTSNAERVADHFINVAKTVRKFPKRTRDR